MSNEGYLMAEDPSVDLEIAEIFVEELEDYITGDDLYRTVLLHTSAGDSRHNMSGGDLLTRLGRLQGERDSLSPDEQIRLGALQKQVDEIIYSLQTRFMKWLNLEFKSRSDSLRYFLKECVENPARCRTEYPYEMRNRQRIEEILNALGEDAQPALVSSLEQIDKNILRATKEAPFVWDPKIASVYPPERYWYLYRRP